MDKTLILMRHAQAQDASLSQKDYDRALTDRGLSDASKMGAKLSQLDLRINLLVASSAHRTKMTGKAIVEHFPNVMTRCVDKLYNASSDTLLEFVEDMDRSINTLMIIGHNNGISHFASYLVDQPIDHFVPATFVVLDLHVDAWASLAENTCTIRHYYSPSLI